MEKSRFPMKNLGILMKVLHISCVAMAHEGLGGYLTARALIIPNINSNVDNPNIN